MTTDHSPLGSVLQVPQSYPMYTAVTVRNELATHLVLKTRPIFSPECPAHEQRIVGVFAPLVNDCNVYTDCP